MVLVYLLIALTFSSVLTAILSPHVAENRQGDVFIGSFVAFTVTAWAADAWLIPALSAGLKIMWLPVTMLALFMAVLGVSAFLSVNAPRRVVAGHGRKLEAEAAVFDLVIWLAVLTLGIAVMASLGM